jgi:peroxiredoxin
MQTLGDQLVEMREALLGRERTPQAQAKLDRIRQALAVEPDTLTERLALVVRASDAVPDAAMKERLDAARREIAALQLAETALGVGDALPTFALPDAHGATVRSTDLLAAGPVVIAFYRGLWCPFCNLELRALQARAGEIAALGATLVAISPQPVDRTVDTVELNRLTYPVLSDAGNVVAQRFGIVYRVPAAIVEHQAADLGFDVSVHNGAPGEHALPLPATFVADRDGAVTLASVDADYRRRLDPEAVLDALRRL